MTLKIGPKIGINSEINQFSVFVLEKKRVGKVGCFAFPGGPGGFREVREADRNRFLLSWYLLVSVVTSYDQKPCKKKVWEYNKSM